MSHWPQSGCGAAIVKDGRILLVKRMRPPEAGSWSLPGGKIDPDELYEAAIRREVEEELGIRLAAARLLCVVNLIGEGQHWVSPVVIAGAFDGEPRNMEPDKHEAIGWFGLDAPPSPLAQSAVQALEALRGQD